MAWSAFWDGPYGFSFELNRTTPAVAEGRADADADATGSADDEREIVTSVLAAPAPSSCANLRREMDIVILATSPGLD